ncbi:SIS domain-containing protein [Pseudorhodobacter aquimaris]|uniref:SIS domain-containing protein n=1 Tax=Pseudorhodobacter aquimaris TaxID=687412 RepID=UPI00067AC980|nr:SIS domain-containing protein [Pseudorhodobacter aquimaris]
MPHQTHMRREILEIPDVVETLLTQGKPGMEAAAGALAACDPRFIVSVARGSSDHAATYFKYICEMEAGIPVASVGLSVTSIYGRKLSLQGAACLAVSQSGKSPDILRMAEMATAGGAVSLALTNHPESALAKASTHTLQLHAGLEQSVAATKTFVSSIVSLVWLLAEWRQDRALRAAIHDLPEVLSQAVTKDWSALGAQIASRPSLYCLGRGPASAIADEAALKFKETCQLHAESFSSAEVLHGPVSIVDRGFPVLAFAAVDAAEQSVADVADAMAAKGAAVFVTSDKAGQATALPCARTAHPLTDPVSLVVSFYAMVEQLAVARGINPDAPRHLKKVTETL